MHNEPTIGNQCGHYPCQRRPASTQRVNLLGWGKILSVKNVTTKLKTVYPSPRSQALKCLSRMWPLSKLQLLRGTQRRFPPKYPENTFQAIQSTFRSLEMHSQRCQKICICSVILRATDREEFSKLLGLQYYFPENLYR